MRVCGKIGYLPSGIFKRSLNNLILVSYMILLTFHPMVTNRVHYDRESYLHLCSE